jgi:glutathione S-transferase
MVAFNQPRAWKRPSLHRMRPALTLHYAPDNASLCVRLAMLELGLPFSTRLVSRSDGAQRDPAYLALNPNGQIPTLETPDGPLFETGAILLWLADRYRDGPHLTPAPTDPARGPVLTWLFWLSNSLHPQLRLIFYPDKHIAAPHLPALKARTRERIGDSLDILEGALPRLTGWLGAAQPSVLDCYLCPMLRWLKLYPAGETDWFDADRWPGLLAVACRMETRPSTAAAILAEGLGRTPFSRPTYPVPPEGSAL